MPGITGIQFLESIIKDHPFPVRIILTGYSDIDTVMDAINRGKIFRYILKPFDIAEIKVILDNAYDLYLFRKSSKETISKYNHFFENSNDAIFIMDDGGLFREMNGSGLSLFKIKPQDLLDVDLYSLFLNPGDYRKVYAQLVKNESVIDLPIKLKSGNNDVIEGLFSASKIKDHGRIIGFQGMIRDITQQKAIENLVIRTIIETQENERVRFGKNLHDGVGSMLAAIKVMIHTLAAKDERLKSDPEVATILGSLNSAIVEMRSVCFNIMPASLQHIGLSDSLYDLSAQFERVHSLKIKQEINNDLPKLNEHLSLAIFRIVQEFFNNSVTHGKATKISLNLSQFNDGLNLVLSDNGIGFNPNTHSAGLGIHNIRTRVQSYNGDIDIKSTLGEGTTFTIKLPVIHYVSNNVVA
ncbi:MAG: ATP-binding protein, partial [Bacteroidia bacterium]